MRNRSRSVGVVEDAQLSFCKCYAKLRAMAPKKHYTSAQALRVHQLELLEQCRAWGIGVPDKTTDLDILELRVALARRCSPAAVQALFFVA